MIVMSDFTLIIRWVFRDMFALIRDCCYSISLGGVSFYDFLLSCLVVFFAFKISMQVYKNSGGGSE